jgi:Flp pilus assembly protein TadG
VSCKVRLLTYARMFRMLPSPPARRTRPWRHRSHDARRGQSLVEFGLVLPFILLTLMAILEFGWYAAVSSATVSASREAARYGSTVGGTDPDFHYVDCDGIRDAARLTTGPLITLADGDIVITYDDGAGGPKGTCPVGADTASVTLNRFDRVIVQVTVNYTPLTPIFNAFVGPGPYPLVSVDRRSIGKP